MIRFRQRIKELCGNKKLLFICGLNILLVLAVLCFFIPLYETDDDFTLGVIASGNFGREYMQYLIYSNVLYGYVLKFLGIVFGGVNWFIVMQYLLLTAAVISIFYVTTFYVPVHVAVFANLIFWYAGFFELIQRIQYTRTAALLVIAGFLLIWNAAEFPGKARNILGIVLCVCGACLRFNCFALCAVFFCPLLFLFCFSKEGFRKTVFKKYVIRLSVLFCIAGLLMASDFICYSMNEEWSYYKDYNDARTQLLDFGIPSFQENRERYEEIGFSENDMELLSNWVLADYDKFNYEDLNKIASWKEKPKITLLMIKQFVKEFLAQKHSVLVLDLWLALAVAALFGNNRCRIYVIVNAGLLLGEYFYLFYIGRTLPRVEYGILWSAVLSLAACLLNDYGKRESVSVYNSKKYIAGMLIFVLLFMGNDYMSNYRDYHRGIKEKKWEKQWQILESLSENEDNVYLLDPFSFSDTCSYYTPYRKVPSYYQSNFYFMGGWTSGSPLNKSLLRKLGLENPMSDLIHKENVYYVKAAEFGMERELLFLQENYDRDIEIQVADSVNGYNIYKFSGNRNE